MWIERSVVKRQRPALALILIICRTCCSPARLRPSHPCPAAAASTAASTEQPINPRLAQSRRSAPHGSAADACRNLPRQGRLPARQLPRQPATSLARSPNGDSLALHFSLCVTVPRRRRPLLLPPRKLSANTANRVPSFDTTPPPPLDWAPYCVFASTLFVTKKVQRRTLASGTYPNALLPSTALVFCALLLP